MQTFALSALACLLLPIFSSAQRIGNPITSIIVTPNSTFDDPNASTSDVTCISNLERTNASTFGGVPLYPYIGGTPAIDADGDNSPTCDSCWNVTFNDAFVLILAITHSDDTFQLSSSAFNALTNKTSTSDSSINAEVQLVDNMFCGLP